MPKSTKESSVAAFTNLDKKKLLKKWYFSKSNIKTVLDNEEQFEKINLYREAFIDLGFNNNQIIKSTFLSISKIKLLIDHFQFLNRFTDSIESIISIAGQIGSEDTITALLEHHEALIKLDFRNLICNIIDQPNAARSIEIILHYSATDTYESMNRSRKKSKLINQLEISLTDFQFTAEEMTKILAHVSGATNFDSILKYYLPLRNLGFSRGNIIQLAGSELGSLKLNHATDNAQNFFKYGCSIEDIMELYNPDNGVEIARLKLQQLKKAKALENTIQKNSQVRVINREIAQVQKRDRNLVINKCRFSEKQLDSILQKPSAIATVMFLKKHYEKLMHLLDNDSEALYRIANHKSGHVSLEAFIDYYPKLINHFTANQIASLASHTGGKNNLDAIEKNLNTLTANGFILSKQEIINVASFEGGGIKIIDLIANIDDLTKYKTNLEIYSYYNQPGKRRADFLLKKPLEKIISSSRINSTETEISDTKFAKTNNNNISSAKIGIFSSAKRKFEADNFSTSQISKQKKTHNINGSYDNKTTDSESEGSYFQDLDIDLPQCELPTNVVTPDIGPSDPLNLDAIPAFDRVFYEWC